MKLAFISTTNSVNKISKLGDIDFCLAPYCYGENYDYFNKSKRYVILDNGIAENKLISNEDLVQMAINMKVKEIIVPDVIGNYNLTKKKRKEFLDKYYNILKKNKIKIQSVIQGNNYFQYAKSLKELNAEKRIDVIGVPFRMNYFIYNERNKDYSQMLNRIYFIQNNKFKKPIHLLGNNLPIELWHLSKYARSCDSKLVTRFGKLKQLIDITDIQKPIEKLDINDVLDDNQINISILNAGIIKEIANGRKY